MTPDELLLWVGGWQHLATFRFYGHLLNVWEGEARIETEIEDTRFQVAFFVDLEDLFRLSCLSLHFEPALAQVWRPGVLASFPLLNAGAICYRFVNDGIMSARRHDFAAAFAHSHYSAICNRLLVTTHLSGVAIMVYVGSSALLSPRLTIKAPFVLIEVK